MKVHPNYDNFPPPTIVASVLFMQIDSINHKLIAAYSDNTLVVWDSDTLNNLFILNHAADIITAGGPINSLSPPLVASKIIVASSLNRLTSWNYESGININVLDKIGYFY
jgi:WD40 repeat protein